jgi:hypothetical protein
MSFGDPVVCSNIVDCGNQCLVKTKTITLVFAASLLRIGEKELVGLESG